MQLTTGASRHDTDDTEPRVAAARSSAKELLLLQALALLLLLFPARLLPLPALVPASGAKPPQGEGQDKEDLSQDFGVHGSEPRERDDDRC